MSFAQRLSGRPTCPAILSRLLNTRAGQIGLLLLTLHLLVMLFAPWLVPYDFAAADSLATLQAPSTEHWFGTDQMGRDVLSRTLMGGREAMITTFPAALLAVAWGSLAGLFIALRGGRLEDLTLRLVDALLSIPWLLFMLLIISLAGPGPLVFIITLGFFYGIAVIRVVLTAAREVLCRDFVTAARLRGDGDFTLLRREVIPNVMDVILVEIAMRWSWMLLAFSSLSFLGFGVSPPTPDWGLMIADSRGFMSIAPWAVLAPIIALSSLIIAINLTSDALAKTLGIDKSSAVH
ncbi:ABC transporter permease [Oceanimonas doudoroffii]|uniref:Peptide ABC transporter permease n=1 Tax=Oceanimonas doudoroffii TaxID=84158 RepID=A0A233RC70_9GAMM|nr:ABC transporter permease [Oceanimonas doudoroffii]OXY80980.1 peptide ABC transporter permease [Oceanimonas doudoroffii]